MGKDFRSKSAAANFFSAADEPAKPAKTAAAPVEHYRVNLKLRPQYKQYLTEAAWLDRKSITEYINDLIEADKQKRGQTE
ncbi:MAG: hypothetical protein BWY65_00742 [Firmicutes bacterium ADurb.Bin373]|nr:MAG: hypothetical protein BWY65_00742 [Firmicutes bacterium ADurb.Bin373]